MLRLACVAIVISAAACGSSSSGKSDAPNKMDGSGKMDAAPPMPDAPTAVVTVPCAGITPDATVTMMDGVLAYSPASTTISQGQVVKFITTGTHDVFPGHFPADATTTDPGIHVDFSMTGCKRFTMPGDYGFHCSMHRFNGTVTVQ